MTKRSGSLQGGDVEAPAAVGGYPGLGVETATPNRAAKLTKSVVDEAKPGAVRYIIHDEQLKGFRLVVAPSGKKTFAVRFRVGGGRGATIREPTIGQYGVLTVVEARKIATGWLADAAKGLDPSAERATERKTERMSDLFQMYLEKHATPQKKKRSSIVGDRLRIQRHLVPTFAKMKVREVERRHVVAFVDKLRDRPIEANRCLALLSKTFNLAEAWGLRDDNTNPCRHVERYKENKRRRFLSPAELARLGSVLRQAEDGEHGHVTWQSIAFVRLAVLSGMRKGEILGLRWHDIDYERGVAVLRDTKTEPRDVHLPPAAMTVLSSLPQETNNSFVLPGARAGAAIVNLNKNGWYRIREVAALDDVHLHDLRHSFASVGVGGGASLPIIGALLGHTTPATTARYAHLASDPLRAASDAIGTQIATAMEGGGGGMVLPLRVKGPKRD